MATSTVKRVLVGDFHDIVRRGIRAALEREENWEIVAEATNCREALEMARETKPDICILDYALPEMNGISLSRNILREFPDTEILIFTSHDNESVVREVLKAGARAFLLKTEADRHLIGALEALSAHQPYFTGSVAETLLMKYLKGGPADQGPALTDREREVVQLIAEGKINREVGRLLEISVKTVETHRASAMQKLKLRTVADLVRYAVRNHIVES